jgi:hypothetical protein
MYVEFGGFNGGGKCHERESEIDESVFVRVYIFLAIRDLSLAGQQHTKYLVEFQTDKTSD